MFWRRRKRKYYLALLIICVVGAFFIFRNGKDEGFGDKTIIIDAGHGGGDPGCNYEGVLEKDVNLNIALALSDILQQQGYKTVMLRDSDSEIVPLERAAFANEKKGDIFISIHQNAVENNTEVYGIETWYNKTTNKNSKKLADCIHKSTVNSVDAKDREIRESEELIVTREVKIPSILIETGFLSNQTEREKLSSSEYQHKLAQGIADGINKYFK